MRTRPRKNNHSELGASIGLRPALSQPLQTLNLKWVEVISDDYIGIDRRNWLDLEKHREKSEIVFHGVGLDIGGTDPLDLNYLASLKSLFAHFEPSWVSDHICWTNVLGHPSFDLLPLPYNQECLEHLCGRIHFAQDYCARTWTFENPSLYLLPENSDMSEGDFFSELQQKTGCNFLLDLNNIHVSSHNLKLDTQKILKGWPFHAVVQFHLAGALKDHDYLIDTHNQIVSEPVWKLFREVLKITGPKPCLIEWDRDFPEFQVLFNQYSKAQGILDEFARVPDSILPAAP